MKKFYVTQKVTVLKGPLTGFSGIVTKISKDEYREGITPEPGAVLKTFIEVKVTGQKTYLYEPGDLDPLE